MKVLSHYLVLFYMIRKLIAVDGLSASGKGSIARKLGGYLSLPTLDTGKLYRFVAYHMKRKGCDLHDIGKIAEIARSISVSDEMPNLYDPEIGSIASKIAVIPEVRGALLEIQRQFAYQDGGAILDGRDIGSVVCPDADYKLFVAADLHTRAKRRFKELQSNGMCVKYHDVMQNLKLRDARDAGRCVAPLIIMQDAVHVDTSDMNRDEAFQCVLDLLNLN